MIPAQTDTAPSAAIQTMEKYSRIMALRTHKSRFVTSVIRQTEVPFLGWRIADPTSSQIALILTADAGSVNSAAMACSCFRVNFSP